MPRFVVLAAAAVAVLAAPAAQARESGEAKLARLLKGRVAGEPVDCIDIRHSRNGRIITGTAIVYDAGKVIYVNRPDYPRLLYSSDVMVTNTTQSRFCKVEVVNLLDSTTWMSNGVVGLNQFVPYRRKKED